jgi:HNH endonuclease/NUMOD4 motif-containing protein
MRPMNEEWRPIRGYEAEYSVSRDGRIRRDLDAQGRPSGLILKPGVVGKYLMVSLSRHGFSRRHLVHRLVAEAFLGPVPEGRQTNHRNGRHHENAADNLEYITASENVRQTYAMGRQPLRGDSNGNASITEAQAREIRRLYADGLRQADICRRLSLPKWIVFSVVRWRSWKHLQ